MADEFLDRDLDTPTEADLDLAYGSKFLSTTDIGTRKIRTKIIKVRKAKLRGNDGTERTRFVLFFEGLDKGLVLNAVNKDRLVAALGRMPAKWENRQRWHLCRSRRGFRRQEDRRHPLAGAGSIPGKADTQARAEEDGCAGAAR